MASSPAQSLLQLDGCGQASTKTIGGSRGEYRSVAYHHPRWCGRGIGATVGAGVELALSCTCACEELHYGTTKSNNREGEGGEGSGLFGVMIFLLGIRGDETEMEMVYASII